MKKYLSYDEALRKMQAYCAYQERCHKEVKEKLIALGIYGDDLDNIIVDLIEQKFLDEQRFANLFIGSKFRQKRWGKIKIMQAIKAKGVSAYCIKKGFKNEITDEAYQAALYEVIEKKDKLIAAKNLWELKQKLAKYAINRGFESWLVWEVLENYLQDNHKH
ncbi:MAG: RecX family transcriptional regulator [Saprospiraceae bacterium]|nr:RecX family transcriptional regulator [Saprospiraceae bacterium]